MRHGALKHPSYFKTNHDSLKPAFVRRCFDQIGASLFGFGAAGHHRHTSDGKNQQSRDAVIHLQEERCCWADHEVHGED
jgi:hypothetical protein